MPRFLRRLGVKPRDGARFLEAAAPGEAAMEIYGQENEKDGEILKKVMVSQYNGFTCFFWTGRHWLCLAIDGTILAPRPEPWGFLQDGGGTGAQRPQDQRRDPRRAWNCPLILLWPTVCRHTHTHIYIYMGTCCTSCSVVGAFHSIIKRTDDWHNTWDFLLRSMSFLFSIHWAASTSSNWPISDLKSWRRMLASLVRPQAGACLTGGRTGKAQPLGSPSKCFLALGRSLLTYVHLP